MRDRDLVKRILDGDAAAGELLVSEHYAWVYRWLYHLTGNAEDAEDLVQQTFVKAWQGLATFRGDASLKTWLHHIAYHEYTHFLRSRRPGTDLDAEEASDASAADAFDAVLVRHAVAQLSPEIRETFLLYHVQGFSVSEVASTLGVPAGTVKSRLFTARQRLRESLSDAKEAVTNAMPTAHAKCETQ